jgi:glucan phosphoethanolaminetransferase (alkaline phosphatase superfamily)
MPLDRPKRDRLRDAWNSLVSRAVHAVPLVLLLSLTEAVFATVWLGQPLRTAFFGAAASVPGLVFLGIFLANLRGKTMRGVALAFVFVATYAEYAFAVYYGRFLKIGEFQVVAANPLRELLGSIRLYVSGTAVAVALITTAICALVFYRRAPSPPRRRWALTALPVTLLWGFTPLGSDPSLPVGAPLFSFATTNLRALASRALAVSEPPGSRHVPREPTNRAVDFDIIYLVGESLRADRFTPGAYERNVAPFLRSLPQPHVSFTNVTSHGDCTGRSVPYLMVAPRPPLHKELYQRPSLFAYARKAGFRTSFVYDNENDWKEFVDENIDVLKRNVELQMPALHWTFESDAQMLPVIEAIANAPGRQFLVVETYTSHWPYADRYVACGEACRVYRPDSFGTPVPFELAYQREIVNSYDNAVMYFDNFFKGLLKVLHKPTLIVFTSDHGEALGDDGRWGHCSGGIEQVLVPLMMVATDPEVARAAQFEQLARVADLPVGHANIFATLLRYFGYEPDLLEFSYPVSLDRVAGQSGRERSVLVSEIGTGHEPVSFSFIDAHRQLVHTESAIPN